MHAPRDPVTQVLLRAEADSAADPQPGAVLAAPGLFAAQQTESSTAAPTVESESSSPVDAIGTPHPPTKKKTLCGTRFVPT
jgi:hypothetical protein